MRETASVARKTMLCAVLGYLSILTLLYVLVPNLIHRRQFDRAFESWHKDPTSQNEAFLRIEQHRNTIVHLETSATGAFVLWIASFACYRIVRCARR